VTLWIAITFSLLSGCEIRQRPAESIVKHTSVNGVTLTYQEQGQGTPVVFVHGSVADYRVWNASREAVARQHRFIALSQRYFGTEPWGDSGPRFSMATHVEDLTALVAELQPGPLSLVGYSWGALLAMLYAIEAKAGRAGPEPARLALLDPAPISRAFRDRFEAEFAARQSGPAVTALRDQLAASGLKEADPAKARDLTPFRVTGRVQQSVWESLGEFDLVPALRDLRIPSLVVHGRQDPIPLASAMAAAEALSAHTGWLDACGHVPYVEQPEALFRSVRDFLHDTESLVQS